MEDNKCFAWADKDTFMEIPSLDNLCKALKYKFTKQDEIIENLKKENQELKEEVWKDKKLQEMEKRLKRMEEEYLLGFPISKEDYEKAQNWITQHEKEKHSLFNKGYSRGGCIGGSYTWEFTPTGIGTFGTVKCTCGDSFDFQKEY